MTKTAYIRARVEPDLKNEAEGVLCELGLSTSEAVTLFMRQIVLHRGLPFPVRIPNEQTVAALREDLRDAQRYDSARELLDAKWGDDK